MCHWEHVCPVPGKHGGMRLNRLFIPHFQNAYPSGHSQNDSEGELVGVNKLKDAYFHVHIQPLFRKDLAIQGAAIRTFDGT